LNPTTDNLHPMKLGKILANKFTFISNIKKLDRRIISVNIKYRHEETNLWKTIVFFLRVGKHIFPTIKYEGHSLIKQTNSCTAKRIY